MWSIEDLIQSEDSGYPRRSPELEFNLKMNPPTKRAKLNNLNFKDIMLSSI